MDDDEVGANIERKLQSECARKSKAERKIMQNFSLEYSIQLNFLLVEFSNGKHFAIKFISFWRWFLFMQKYSKASYEKIACNQNQEKGNEVIGNDVLKFSPEKFTTIAHVESWSRRCTSKRSNKNPRQYRTMIHAEWALPCWSHEILMMDCFSSRD